MDRTAIREWIYIALLMTVLLFALNLIGVMWYQTFHTTCDLNYLYQPYGDTYAG
jgi:hypothetical protein